MFVFKEMRKMGIVERKILLNPGPATTTDSVKMAQVVPDICPREREFGDLMDYVSESLASFVAPGGDYAAVLFGGSGTSGVEAVLSSVVGDGESVVVVNNGAYGKRMCDILRIHSIDFHEFVSSPVRRIDLEELDRFAAAAAERGARYLSCVHSETTSGLLNDIGSIGEIARRRGLSLIVDAMSSFGAVPIDMRAMNISFLVSSSNKNLQGMPGVVFVIASKRDLENREGKRPRTLYLDLYAQYDYFVKTRQTRFTPPVQTLYALKRAVDELKEETVEGRYARYTENWRTLKEGLDGLGLKRLVSDEDHSHIITSVCIPDIEGFSFEEMHDRLYAKGITVYPGKISDSNTFRIANIGAITKDDVLLFLGELKSYLDSL